MADETVGSHAESLEELSGEWMRQQLQEAAVNTAPPVQETVKRSDPAPRSAWSAPAATAAPAAQEAAEPGADDVLTGLAQSVSQAVVSAVSQLEHRRVEEKRTLERTVLEQEQRLGDALGHVAEMQRRLDKLSSMLEEQQNLARGASDSYERLSGAIAEIQTLHSSREGILDELRRETMDLSVSVSDRQDQVSGRLDLQQTDLEGVKSELAQLKPSIEKVAERLNRHSQAIRAVFEAEKRREDTLQQLSEAAAGLKASTLRYPEGLSEELL